MSGRWGRLAMDAETEWIVSFQNAWRGPGKVTVTASSSSEAKDKAQKEHDKQGGTGYASSAKKKVAMDAFDKSARDAFSKEERRRSLIKDIVAYEKEAKEAKSRGEKDRFNNVVDALRIARNKLEEVGKDASGLATDPPVSEAQRKWAFANKNKGGKEGAAAKEFANADPGGKLPARVKA